jgi:HEAT repeat protein
MFRQASGPHLVEQLDSYDPERRFFATLCLAEVVYAPALGPLVSRLYDTDYPTATAAIESLRAYRKIPAFDDALAALRATVQDTNAPSDRRRTAANVLGELRDVEAVEPLLRAVDDRDGALAGIARRALVTLSRQDFGQDAGSWRLWWADARRKHRVEWLIDALLHADPGIRHDASEELKKLSGQFFGYYFNLPRRERERAHQRYAEWWHREGAARFR